MPYDSKIKLVLFEITLKEIKDCDDGSFLSFLK